jgi:hypothetical protein
MELHDEFLELCALSTSGDLTEEEQRLLQAHLSGCAECRQALKEFEAAVDIGVPLLTSRLAGAATSLAESGRSSSVVSAASKVPICDGAGAEGNGPGDARKRAVALAQREGHRVKHV